MYLFGSRQQAQRAKRKKKKERNSTTNLYYPFLCACVWAQAYTHHGVMLKGQPAGVSFLSMLFEAGSLVHDCIFTPVLLTKELSRFSCLCSHLSIRALEFYLCAMGFTWLLGLELMSTCLRSKFYSLSHPLPAFVFVSPLQGKVVDTLSTLPDEETWV